MIKSKEQQQPLLSPEEVAEALHVTKRTVYNWLRSGKLHGRKFGGVWRVSASALVIPPESVVMSDETRAEIQAAGEELVRLQPAAEAEG